MLREPGAANAFARGLTGLEARLRFRQQMGGARLPRDLAERILDLLEVPEGQGQGEGRDEDLEAVARDLAGCTRCGLHRTRKTIVTGEGNPRARLVFVGEGPGEEEDLQGRPFVGAAGQLLNKIIEAMGFQREEVFIANVVKCRPPSNRTPKPDEVSACRSFLVRQLKALSPQVICAMGAVAAQALLHTGEGISRLRGRFHQWEGIPLMPTYHPSYLLRNPERKRDVWEDMKQVMALLK